jgi:hypothetical protein
MKTKFGATVLAAAFLAALVIPTTILAGRGGMGGGSRGSRGTIGGGGTMRDQTLMQDRVQDRQMDQTRDRDRDRLHQETGSGAARTTTGDTPTKGNTYGPGDGTGPYLPKDGTGYGAPANR